MSNNNTPNHQPPNTDIDGVMSNEIKPEIREQASTTEIPASVNQSLTKLTPLRINENLIEPEELHRQHQEEGIQDNFANNTDWFALARKLRQHNRELIKTVVQLEQALADSQEKLKSQIMRSRSADTLIAQQTEEINSTQEQVTRLLQELESAHQVAQHQQNLIDNLSTQLDTSNNQIAELERECAILQESYQQMSQELMQSEQQTRELRMRLYRQQRHTLQFKAALDQCLDVPEDSGVSNSSLLNSNMPITPANISPSFRIPKASPIQPWSDQLEIASAEEYLSELSVPTSSELEATPELESENLVNYEPELVTEISPIAASIDSLENDEQINLETLITPENDLTKTEETELKIEKTLIPNITEPETPRPKKVVTSPQIPAFNINRETAKTESEILAEKELPTLINQPQEPIYSPEPPLNLNKAIMPPQANSPSPLLYPLRARKSKSAKVDLPKFLR